MRGIDITVLHPVLGKPDAMGEPVVTWKPETVENVLVAAVSTERVEQDGRANSADNTITAYFPKTYTTSLLGARLKAYGTEWNVIGDPLPHLIEGHPTAWNRRVSARKVEG